MKGEKNLGKETLWFTNDVWCEVDNCLSDLPLAMANHPKKSDFI